MLRWGMVGGGEGSQIGPAHRLAARLDGLFAFEAGALDHVAERGRDYGARLGLHPSRAYGDWREMLEGERAHDDRIDLVTIATPNATHHQIALGFLRAGHDVMLEKPMTATVAEAEELVAAAREAGRLLSVNYGYTGYPLVRHMRAMVARGDLGRVRLVVAEHAHGHHADAADADNPRIRWRYDPAQMGASAQFADCGIHALNMAAFVTGQRPEAISADFMSAIPSRTLEDDAQANVRLDGGARVRLWTSAVASGRTHGLAIQVFGERGGLRWEQEDPNRLYWSPVGGRTVIIERGQRGLSPEHDRASRVTIGHAEGMVEAFANLYADLAERIQARKDGREPDPATLLTPSGEDGLVGVRAIHAAVESAGRDGAWVAL